MTVQTNSQKMSQAAYQQIMQRRPTREFTSFAREFPTIVHACGLAQAVAFAQAKGGHQEHYLRDLTAVLEAAGHTAIATNAQLAESTRTAPMATYLRLSRDALLAAIWLKRYVEAAEEPSTPSTGE